MIDVNAGVVERDIDLSAARDMLLAPFLEVDFAAGVREVDAVCGLIVVRNEVIRVVAAHAFGQADVVLAVFFSLLVRLLWVRRARSFIFAFTFQVEAFFIVLQGFVVARVVALLLDNVAWLLEVLLLVEVVDSSFVGALLFGIVLPM